MTAKETPRQRVERIFNEEAERLIADMTRELGGDVDKALATARSSRRPHIPDRAIAFLEQFTDDELRAIYHHETGSMVRNVLAPIRPS